MRTNANHAIVERLELISSITQAHFDGAMCYESNVMTLSESYRAYEVFAITVNMYIQ